MPTSVVVRSCLPEPSPFPGGLRAVMSGAILAVSLAACMQPAAPSESPAVTGPPPADPVTDLAVEEVEGSTVRLTFTEVPDTTGSPADYLVRFQIAPIDWSSAASVTNGTCAGRLAGSSIGERRTCTVESLSEGQTYEFQVVSLLGRTPDIATGDLSNVASATIRSTLAPPTDGSAWVVEDWSSYSTVEEFFEDRDPHEGRYRTEAQNAAQMALDPEHRFGESPHALRYDFPDRSGSDDRCHDYSIGRDLYLPEETTELWVEVWVKFSPNFATAAPESWGCQSNPDHKILFGNVWPDGGVGRFGIHAGVFGDRWLAYPPYDTNPDDDSWDYVDRRDSAEDWDGEWHRIRTHWRVSNDGKAVNTVWIDDHLLTDRQGFSTDATGIWGLRLGANLNQGPHEAMSYWWGRVEVWRDRPAWDN